MVLNLFWIVYDCRDTRLYKAVCDHRVDSQTQWHHERTATTATTHKAVGHDRYTLFEHVAQRVCDGAERSCWPSLCHCGPPSLDPVYSTHTTAVPFVQIVTAVSARHVILHDLKKKKKNDTCNACYIIRGPWANLTHCCFTQSRPPTRLTFDRENWGWYHGGRRPSSDDSFHNQTVIPPSALDKPIIKKRYHRRRTCSHTSPRRLPTMVTLHDTRFVECRWWNDGWTVKTVVTWRSLASMIPAPGLLSSRSELWDGATCSLQSTPGVQRTEPCSAGNV